MMTTNTETKSTAIKPPDLWREAFHFADGGMNIIDITTEAAARLNLTRGRDNKWHFDAGNPVASDNEEVRHER